MKSKKMKSSPPSLDVRMATRRIPVGLVLVLAGAFLHQGAAASVLAVDLGVAADFAVLAGAGITIAGPVVSSGITGNIGSHPTGTITGLENLTLFGLNHAADGVTQQGKVSLSASYVNATGRIPTLVFPPIHELGGLTLTSGVYNDPSSFSINGMLTLDGGGDEDAVWIFQMGSTLITGAGSSVNMINGAQAANIFWQVGSSATLGSGSHFEGTILAQESITLNSGATMIGRALAITGAVTMDNNIISVPEAGSTMLFASGLALVALRRRRRR